MIGLDVDNEKISELHKKVDGWKKGKMSKLARWEYLDGRKYGYNKIVEREYINRVRDAMSVQMSVKRKMSNVMDKGLTEQFEELQKIPNHWIRLIGAGSGGYFLLSSKLDNQSFNTYAQKNKFQSFSKANISEIGVSQRSF